MSGVKSDIPNIPNIPNVTRADVNGILDAYMKEVGIIRPVQTNNFDSFLLFKLPGHVANKKLRNFAPTT